jgi:hypothetical protein
MLGKWGGGAAGRVPNTLLPAACCLLLATTFNMGLVN